MANGDDALAAGMDVIDPSTDLVKDGGDEINKTRDYIAQRTSTTLAVANGGTGSTTAAGARTNLGVPSTSDLTTGLAGKAATSHTHSSLTGSGVSFGTNTNIGGGTGFWSNARLGCAGRLYVSDHAFFTGLSAASSGYTVAYINGDGRLSEGASSARYKNSIRDAQNVSNTFAAPLREFKMNGGDDSYRVGYIAEELEANGLERFVVYKDGEAHSIDFIAFLMAQNAELNERVKALEAAA